MTLPSPVLTALENLGEVSPVGPSTCGDVVLEPGTYPDATGPTGMRLVVGMRRHGAGVRLDFSACVGVYCEDLDVNLLRAWAAAHPALGIGRVRVAGYDMAGTGVGEGRVVVTHSNYVDCADGPTITEIVSELVSLWQEARRQLERLRFVHRKKLRHERMEARAEERRAARLQNARSRLDELVGLDPVKDLVRQLVARQQFGKHCTSAGLKPVVVSPHLVFTGNPGTGKTTVARIVADVYKELGLLSKGHVVEVDRGGLVADYVGQTATKTKAACEKARGGILFIDEAYSLARDSGLDFGREAIDTLVKFMEDNRGEIAVIVAGYPDRMAKFMGTNPGLSSRFDLTVDFPDYSDLELMEILGNMLVEHDFVFGPGARYAAFGAVRSLRRGENFGNAREVRRLFETIVGRHAELVAQVPGPERDLLRTISSAAVPVSDLAGHEFVDLTGLK